MKRTVFLKLLQGFLFLTFFFVLQACYKKPEFDFAPKIDFDRIRDFPLTTVLTKQDSVVISLKFQDGNGDLGLTSADRSDTSSLYAEYIKISKTDSIFNPFYFNYFIDVYKYKGGEFIPVVFPDRQFNFNGAFEPLYEEPYHAGPLEGTLNYGFKITEGPTFQSGDILKFRIQIADRALNLSNIIETDTLRVLQ